MFSTKCFQLQSNKVFYCQSFVLHNMWWQSYGSSSIGLYVRMVDTLAHVQHAYFLRWPHPRSVWPSPIPQSCEVTTTRHHDGWRVFYSGTCVLWTSWDISDYQGVMISQVSLYDKALFGIITKCVDSFFKCPHKQVSLCLFNRNSWWYKHWSDFILQLLPVHIS